MYLWLVGTFSTPLLSFLVTASERTYAIVVNASASLSDRNITGLGVVTDGTPCMPTVCVPFLDLCLACIDECACFIYRSLST